MTPDQWLASLFSSASLGSVTLPTIAILAAGTVALVVVGVETRASRRLHRVDRIALVLDRLADVASEGRKRHENLDHQLDDAMERFSAACSSLQFVLPRRHRAVAHFVRSTVYTGFFEPSTFALLAECSRAQSYFSSWVTGALPARKFRQIIRYIGPESSRRDMSELWAQILEREESTYRTHGGAVATTEWHQSRGYRLMTRRATSRTPLASRIRNRWLVFRNPALAEEYR
jgi:hypothetical protein